MQQPDEPANILQHKEPPEQNHRDPSRIKRRIGGLMKHLLVHVLGKNRGQHHRRKEYSRAQPDRRVDDPDKSQKTAHATSIGSGVWPAKRRFSRARLAAGIFTIKAATARGRTVGSRVRPRRRLWRWNWSR